MRASGRHRGRRTGALTAVTALMAALLTAAHLNPGFPTFDRTQNTLVDWFRWRLYDDTAARDRLAADATGDGTRWEAALA
ncbi:hypothetical protein [Streptomyces sp. NBC_01304]|uniref:hypothetical protein n=1 Tax=Streptomyces sp. NBC_01304 TaxID=2903818 RepID=UPI002E117F93|nr:hypothetical protein OG430_07345 [Streptomyces sp. NBC_01304]